MTASTPVCGLSFLLLLSIPATAQQILTGKIKRRSTDEILPSVSIINHTQKKTNVSDAGGNYKITAKPGDTITFTSAGYKPDTAFVRANPTWSHCPVCALTTLPITKRIPSTAPETGRDRLLYRLPVPPGLCGANHRTPRGFTPNIPIPLPPQLQFLPQGFQ